MLSRSLHAIAFLSHSHPSVSFYLYQQILPNAPFAKLPQVHLRMSRNSVLGVGEAKPIVPRKLASSGGAIGECMGYIGCVEWDCVNPVQARSPPQVSSSIDLYPTLFYLFFDVISH